MTAREVLDGIKGRLAAATPGPWTTGSAVAGTNGVYFGTVHDPEDPTEPGILLGEAHAQDAYFIAAAPVDVARLTRAIEDVLERADRLSKSKQCEDREIAEDLHAAIENALGEVS